jgi:predicted nucleotidyltransferase
VARGEAGPDSDVDFLIELDPAKRISLLGFAHIAGELEDMLGCRVDLVEPRAMRKEWRDLVLEEAVRAAGCASCASTSWDTARSVAS